MDLSPTVEWAGESSWLRDLLSAHVLILGHILELQEYVKYKHALDEADEKDGFHCMKLLSNPFGRYLKLSWMVRKCRMPLTKLKPKCRCSGVFPMKRISKRKKSNKR